MIMETHFCHFTKSSKFISFATAAAVMLPPPPLLSLGSLSIINWMKWLCKYHKTEMAQQQMAELRKIYEYVSHFCYPRKENITSEDEAKNISALHKSYPQ